ncbi:RHS repeat-associated core domain-containing protein [Palleniella intestinalis]|uniref:RHS repeat-associated core domain-containing protein n=1 Tax=Palleniella intestinalis TaxID=2736291 RepID=UPI00351095AF
MRGYTGHEMLPEFDLINMNGRIYDPALGRFLSPDNYVQMPDNTQSFNRYAYCINNPLKYTDPSGEYFGFDDLAAALIGGFMNLTINIFQGNISGNLWSMIGKGASAFGAGAAAGWGALYPELGGWAWGGATLGATNAWLSGGTGTDIFTGAIFGSLTSYFGGAIGQWGAQYLGGIAINGLQITSPFLQGMVSGAIGGMTSGWAIGFAASLMLTGDFDEALNAGNNGLLSGMATGAISGGAGAIKISRDKKVSPWTGERTQNHHSFPKFAGGTDEQVLTPVPESLHREMHREMNQYLYETRTPDGLYHMRPQRGNSGSLIQYRFTGEQRISTIKNFYDLHPFKYPHARYDFYMNNGMQWRPW